MPDMSNAVLESLNADSKRMGEQKRFRVMEANLEAKFAKRLKDLEDRITALEGSKSNSKKGAA